MSEERSVPDLIRGVDGLLDARRYDEALQLANQAVTKDPANHSAHLAAARVLLQLQLHAEAVRAAGTAVQLRPNSAFAQRVLAVALQHQPHAGAKMQAVSVASEAVRLGPMDAANHVTAAETYAETGNRQAADDAIREAIRLAPNSASVWVAASVVAIKARSWRAAEAAARRALVIQPDNYAAINNMGVAMRAQGHWTLAGVAFLDAAHMDPRSATARNNVESIGFRYMASLVPVVLLPLLVFPPAFLVARFLIQSWLMKRPERLQPRAVRLGIRVATRERTRRQLDRRNARMLQRLGAGDGPIAWSSLHERRTISVRQMTVLSGALAIVAAYFLVSAAVGTAPITTALIVALSCLAGSGLLVAVVALRRRYV